MGDPHLLARFEVARELKITFRQVCSMDKWELTHWIALLNIEPPQSGAINVMLAQLCSVVAKSGFCRWNKSDVQTFILDFAKPYRKKSKKLKQAENVSKKAMWLAWANKT